MDSSKWVLNLGDKSVFTFFALACLGSGPLQAFEAQVAIAPQNDMKLTVQAIEGATQSLYINIYQMTSSEVGDAIVKRIQDGLHVEILEEGQPVGGMSKPSIALQSRIVSAMNQARAGDHYYLMTGKQSKRRFRFDHAKYIVVDDEALLIGSENFDEKANPSSAKPGNRGWETFLHDPSLAAAFKATFSGDTTLSYGDVEDLVDGAGICAEPPSLPRWSFLTAVNSHLPDNTTLQVASATVVLSPDSLSGLTSLLASAQSTLDIELMTFSPGWGSGGGTSPLLTAVEEAARRGVKVRVLLNDETVFDHGGGALNRSSSSSGKKSNQITVDTLNQLASSQGLALEARIADIKAMQVSYIHNKGAIVDGGKILVSSINWDQNSVEHNREAGVILDSQDAAKFYQGVFDSDWEVSQH